VAAATRSKAARNEEVCVKLKAVEKLHAAQETQLSSLLDTCTTLEGQVAGHKRAVGELQVGTKGTRFKSKPCVG
jgi:hypothetical protein